MLQEIVQDSFMSTMLCGLFMIYIFTDKSFDKRIKHYFFIITVSILFLIVADDLEMIESLNTFPTIKRSIYTSIGYMGRSIVPLLMTVILLHSTKTEISIQETYVFYSIFAINLIISGASAFTGWVFYYDQNNVFHRGILGIVPFFTGFYYVIIMAYTAFVRIRIKRRGETVVFVFIGLLCVLATMLEAVFHYVGFLTDVSIIGTVLYYLYLHVSIYSFDELTGAYTRRIFYLESEKVRHTGAVIVTMDMNNLKKINDTEGHHSGDRTLTMFCNTLVKNKGKNCMIFRMGGDEFAMLCRDMTEEQVEQRLLSISNILAKEGITFAYGIGAIRPGEDVTGIMEIADEDMYKMKRGMKGGE